LSLALPVGLPIGVLLGVLVLAPLWAPSSASAQLLVAPRRPGQTNVRYAEFDWRYVDILTHEQLELDIEWDHGPRFHLSPFTPRTATPRCRR
jgi:hypothetical protein